MSYTGLTSSRRLRKLDSRPLADRIVDILRDAILVEGRLAPGERLSEDTLAVELGVSKTPVHDALLRLSSEGLVNIVPYQGASVVRLSPHDVDEIYQLRKTLELLALSLAMPNLDDDLLRQLDEEHEVAPKPLRDHGDLQFFEDLNRRFHDALVQFSGNERLGEFLNLLRGRSVSRRLILERYPGRDDQALEEHRAIIAALLARDHKEAEKMLSKQLDISHRIHREIAEALAQEDASDG